jgi:predicted nucleotidyltransferase
MRLSRVEVDDIANAARTTCPPGSRVYLFGSRVDDDRRGGDIDLLVETPQPLPAQQVVSLRNRFTARLYRLIGERRIDVLVAPPAPPGSVDPVIESARAHAIELVRT